MHLLKSQTQANVPAYVIIPGYGVYMSWAQAIALAYATSPDYCIYLISLPPGLWLLPTSQIQTIHLFMSRAQDNEPTYITSPDISSAYFKSQANQSAVSQTQTVAFACGTSTNVTRPGKCIYHVTGFYICLCPQSRLHHLQRHSCICLYHKPRLWYLPITWIWVIASI